MGIEHDVCEEIGRNEKVHWLGGRGREIVGIEGKKTGKLEGGLEERLTSRDR